MSSEEPRKTGFFGWATFGYANIFSHTIMCDICLNSFGIDKFPKVGNSINCLHCDAEAYGTYDNDGNYILEWYGTNNV